MLQKITAGLKAGDKGRSVANLHDALEKLRQTEVLPIGDAAAQKEMLADLALERATQTYGTGLTLAIRVFQGHRELPETGRIVQATCDLLNR